MTKAARTIYRYMTVAFLALVVVEFFFAGIGVFTLQSAATGPGSTVSATDFDHDFAAHLLLGDGIAILSFILVGAAVAARLERRRLRVPAAILTLVLAQATLAFVGPPAVQALHPVAGLLILGAAVYAVRDSGPWQAPRQPQ